MCWGSDDVPLVPFDEPAVATPPKPKKRPARKTAAKKGGKAKRRKS